jgi:hypothetical protein
MSARYRSMYERLVANTVLAEPDNPRSCWLWTGVIGTRGYPQVAQRIDGKVVARRAHRVMLEELHNAEFPFDEGGHLCCTPRCISPMHLEVQTPHQNLSARRGYAAAEGRLIPVLFPRDDEELEAFIDRAWNRIGGETFPPGAPCPF